MHEIYYRKYNQIKDNSLEFFMKNGSSMLVIFYTAKRVEEFLQMCQTYVENF